MASRACDKCGDFEDPANYIQRCVCWKCADGLCEQIEAGTIIFKTKPKKSSRSQIDVAVAAFLQGELLDAVTQEPLKKRHGSDVVLTRPEPLPEHLAAKHPRKKKRKQQGTRKGERIQQSETGYDDERSLHSIDDIAAATTS